MPWSLFPSFHKLQDAPTSATICVLGTPKSLSPPSLSSIYTNPTAQWTFPPNCPLKHFKPQKFRTPPGPKLPLSSCNPRTNQLRHPTRNLGESSLFKWRSSPNSPSLSVCLSRTLPLSSQLLHHPDLRHRPSQRQNLPPNCFGASRPASHQAAPVHTQWFCSRTKTGASCLL